MYNLKGLKCKMQIQYNRPYLKRQREISQGLPLVHVDNSASTTLDDKCNIQI